MDHKTTPIYRETTLGILSMHEIENIIFDNLFLARLFLAQNQSSLDISIETIKLLHMKVCGSLYQISGSYRLHEVEVGFFNPISYIYVYQHMVEFEKDIQIRLLSLAREDDKKDFVSRIMRKFLWIHPFFDYNGRVARLLGEVCCMKLGLQQTNFNGIERKAFTEAMIYATQTHGDISKILLLF